MLTNDVETDAYALLSMKCSDRVQIVSYIGWAFLICDVGIEQPPGISLVLLRCVQCVYKNPHPLVYVYVSPLLLLRELINFCEHCHNFCCMALTPV